MLGSSFLVAELSGGVASFDKLRMSEGIRGSGRNRLKVVP
jgi:hypothetical protein